MNNNWFPRFAARLFGTLAAVGMAWSGLGNAPISAQQTQLAAGQNSLMHNGQSFPVVQATGGDAGGFSLSAFDAPSDSNMQQFGNQIAQVGHRLGTRGVQTNSLGYTTGGTSCPTCVPYRYGMVEGLFMRREGVNNFTAARDFALDDVDFEWAPRITLGVVPDCVNGMEFGFSGVLNWETQESLTRADGLSTLLIEDPLQVGTLGTFGFDPGNEADFQSQRFESSFWSVEMSRTMMAWDVAKLLIGGRYVDFQEEYNYATVNGADPITDTGLLRSEVANRMIGLQVGADIFNPIGRFSSSYVRARAGGYLNLSETDMLVRNGSDILANGSDDSAELAGLFEFGSGVRYQVGEWLAVRGGFETWYLTGVATADNQFNSATVTPTFGRTAQTDDDVFFLGLSFGAELKY